MVEEKDNIRKILLIKFEVIVKAGHITNAEFRVDKEDFEQIAGFLPKEVVVLKLVQNIFKFNNVNLDSIEIIELDMNRMNKYGDNIY